MPLKTMRENVPELMHMLTSEPMLRAGQRASVGWVIGMY